MTSPRRHIQVLVNGEPLATTHRPALIIETGVPPPASLSIRARCSRFQVMNVVLRLVKSLSGPPEPGSR
ncbi:MAG TPA: hypothetical protein VGI05_18130 [Streptosporangiaceae bacterium]|jgi:hypothetical protein